MNHQWTDRLSEYLDGELMSAERDALETHLAGCAHCRDTLAELRAVVARAQSLENRAPAADLWPEIHARLTVRRRFSLTVSQLLAASIALVVLSGGGVWLALRDGSGTSDPTMAAFPQLVAPAGTPVAWRARTDMAVAQLEETLAQNESRLDTATVRVVRQNLGIIDRAIEKAQRALQADPGSAYLNLHLAQTMRRKIELLRRANALAVAES
ncbi:MAG: anti-sigma factor [Gemmatimonadales bacterium]|nr:anti-sigma factor [Gemmatimonadales bacterium]